MSEEKPREVYMTHAMGNLMKDWQANNTPENFEQIQMIVADKFMKVQRKLYHMKPGPDRAKFALGLLQAAIDDVFEKEKIEVSCKSGCAGCCHQQVEISGEEADLLARLIQNGVKIDMDKMRRLSSKKFTDLEWWRLPAEEKRCLFLDEENKCKIYRHRPMACRKYFVFTPPERCSEVSAEGSIEVGVQTITDAEIIATAVMDFVRREGNIPVLLRERLDGFRPKFEEIKA